MNPVSRAAPLLLAGLLLVLALVLPPVELPRPEHRYLAVLDISQSMNVQDAGPDGGAPSRLDLARQALARLADGLPCGAELGLGLFSGHRSLLLTAPVEVCRHREDLQAMVEGLDWTLAWESASEVAEGLFDAIAVAERLEPIPALVFLTDGHEAPPVSERYRMRFDGEPGETPGLLAGVGGERPVPIPKLARDGRQRGVWQPDEVEQVDAYALVNRESASAEQAAELERRIRQGREHLSYRHAGHLDALAAETGLERLHLQAPADLLERLERGDLLPRQPQATPVGWVAALGALALVLGGYLPRRRQGRDR